MITSQDLAAINIEKVIFHDVPKNIKEGTNKPTLAEAETPIDGKRRHHLRARLIRALGSRSAYPICFNPMGASQVPDHVRALTNPTGHHKFVTASQQLAQFLFERQHGAISPGLLCVASVTSSARRGILLLKLEREEGARLELEVEHGKRRFAMSVFDNLVLTDGTRLFKSALFVRTGASDDEFDALACDSQLNVMSSEDIAKFWLSFLGCTFTVEPRVATQHFYESTVRFINDIVADATDKNELYEHLQSQLKSAAKTFAPRRFIEDFVPVKYQKPIQVHFESEHISMNSFRKDTSDIQGRLHRRAYHTVHGAIVSAPTEQPNMIEVRDNQIIVNDAVIRVDRK